VSCIYVFALDENEPGALQHVGAIARYLDGMDLFTITNVSFLHVSASTENVQVPLPSGRSWLIRAAGYWIFQVRVVMAMRRLLKRVDRPTVMLQRQSAGLILPGLYAVFRRIPLVVEVNGLLAQDMVDRKRGILARTINRVTEWLTYRMSKKIIVVHENLIPPLTDSYGIKAGKLTAIENGVHPRKWRLPAEARAELGIDREAVRVGYLGSFGLHEGVDKVMEAIAISPQSSFPVVFVGGTPVEVTKARGVAQEVGIDSRVEFTGSLPYEEAMIQMEACDVLVHLRRPVTVARTNSQGSPLKMLDYHCVGRPVVATDIDSYQYIRDRGFGTLVQDADTFGAARAIEEILESPGRGLDAGRSAHEWVIENRLWKQTVNRLVSELLQVADRHHI